MLTRRLDRLLKCANVTAREMRQCYRAYGQHPPSARHEPPLQSPFTIACQPPLLVASFREPQSILSWSITRPGCVTARQVAWLEVRNADLPPAVDPLVSIRQRFADAGLEDAVGLVTSRDIRRHHLAQRTVEDITATALATAGLSNGERVGARCTEPVLLPGTINILLHVSRALTEAAQIETLSIATQARTAAIMDLGVERAGVRVTGTGTDCIAVASPQMAPAECFAGLHTALGEAVGAAVYDVIREAVEVWQQDWAAAMARHKPAAE